MNTRPTPETDKFFATFADGEAAPSHAEYYARLQDLERERDEAREALRTGGMLNIIDRAAHERATAIRERDEAREELSEWRILNGWGGTPEIINDFIKGQQTRIHHAQDLEAELTTVTEQLDEYKARYIKLAGKYAIETHEITEQRDRLAEVIEQLKSQLTQTQGTVTISRNGYVQKLEQQRDRLEDQLDDAVAEATNAVNDIIGMKWQRDRLAEALRSIKNELGVPQPEYPAPVANAVKIADEALQSLTPNVKSAGTYPVKPAPRTY